MRHYFLKTILLFSIILLVGCKTTKTAVDKNEKLIVNNDIKESEKVTTENNSSVTVTLTSDALVTIIEKIVNEKLSVPDSKGKQVVVERTITERRIDKEESIKAGASGNQKAKQNVIKTKEDHSKQKQINKTKETKKSVTKTPSWVFISVIIIVVCILLFVYFILKKYRIL